MRKNLGSLGHAETTLLIQGAIEELDPQQVLARDLLVERRILPADTATILVKAFGAPWSAILKEALATSEDPLSAVREHARQWAAEQKKNVP